jgi:hypothetical protein
VLHYAVAGAIARDAVLLNETPAMRILLEELEKDRAPYRRGGEGISFSVRATRAATDR